MLKLTSISQLGSLLDRLFILDCSLCIFNCALAIFLLTVTEILGLEHLCFVMFLPNYVHVCNRLLNISIVICRYVFVLHSAVVESGGRRRVFQSCVLCFTFLTPLLLTVPDVYYRDNVYNYLSTCVRCVGPQVSSYCPFKIAELFLTLILALDQDLNDEKVNIYDKLLDVRQKEKPKTQSHF